VNGVVCPKKEKREEKKPKKVLTRAGIVRDVRFRDLPGLNPRCQPFLPLDQPR